MLEELYRYALQSNANARPCFSKKTPKAYVCLDKDADFIGIDPAPPQPVLCPDLGSAAQGAAKCNVPVEKALISLPELNTEPKKAKPRKHAFFLQTLAEAAAQVPELDVLRTALTCQDTVAQICAELRRHEIKPENLIGYKVDGVAVERLDSFCAWWTSFASGRRSAPNASPRVRCLISGELTVPACTVSPIRGLKSVGGRASGDRLICFDKDAFCSYGQKQAANAAVSEQAMSLVNGVLTDLIAQSPRLGGLTAAKWLHWFKRPLPDDMPDPLADLWGDAAEGDDEPESRAEDIPGVPDDAAGAPDPFLAASAQAQAAALLKSPLSGEKTDRLSNEYYILALSGANGRVMVRSWQQGSFEDLQRALDAWWEDLALLSASGKALLLRPRLSQLMYRLLTSDKTGRLSPGERFRKELAGLEPRLMFAILNNTPLPMPVTAKALQKIRSDMLVDNAKCKNEPVPDDRACQLLKVFLRRAPNHEGGIYMQPCLNSNYPNAAYHCGRLMAVYAAIQTAASGDHQHQIKTGVIQRYYASASRAPALTIGRLHTYCQYHLAKLSRDKPGLAVYYEDLLGDIMQKIVPPLPASLDLYGQAEFALGYQQQYAALHKPCPARKTAEPEQTDPHE